MSFYFLSLRFRYLLPVLRDNKVRGGIRGNGSKDGNGRYETSGNLRDGRREDGQQRIIAAERQRARQDQCRERGRR